jgi:hypothetical protein
MTCAIFSTVNVTIIGPSGRAVLQEAQPFPAFYPASIACDLGFEGHILGKFGRVIADGFAAQRQVEVLVRSGSKRRKFYGFIAAFDVPAKGDKFRAGKARIVIH